jgi:general secretion pathway protein G
MKGKQKGFTLIELLVVIAIIGLLASVVMVSVSSARMKARDTKRIADMEQLSKALELYYLQNGFYPISGGATAPNANWSTSNDSSWTTLETTLSAALKKLPKDPLNTSGWPGNSGYAYSYFSINNGGCTAGQYYMLVYRLENPAMKPSPGFLFCNGTVQNYAGAVTFGQKSN